MNAYEKFNSLSKPSVKATFKPFLDRLLQSLEQEEWMDAAMDIEGIRRGILQHQMDEKLKQSGRMTEAEHNTFPKGRPAVII